MFSDQLASLILSRQQDLAPILNRAKCLRPSLIFTFFFCGRVAHFRASPVAQTVKESACNAGDQGSIPGLGRSPGGKDGKPLQYSSLENPHGQRSLAGYSPWTQLSN